MAVFVVAIFNHCAAYAESTASELPLEVRIDLLREQLANHLRTDNNQGIVDLIPQFRALDLELPDNLYFLEGRALHRLGRALEARDRLIVYLRNTGRDGTYYQEATELLLAVKDEADKQERERMEQERLRREEQARRSEKARMLLIREAQSYLGQLGFRHAEESGELMGPTREALAVYQIRRNIPLTGDVTGETLSRLKAEVPESHNCDELTRYARKPGEFGIPVSRIPFQVAVPSCNDALRQYPDVIRFQVQYARALASADRIEDAMSAVKKALDLGYPEAETLIGWLHENGKLSDRGRPDVETAREWYQLAADKNYPPAQANIGRLNLDGRDYDMAVSWYARAANLGYPPAQVELGKLYIIGRGVDKNYEMAYTWIKRAADAGYPDGQYELGGLYERGRGVGRDRTIAVDWYRKAANQGHADATSKVSRLGG